MVFVHILKVIRGYSASIAENARHMQMEVQVIEEKNQELTIANEEAEKAKAEAIAAAKAKSVFLANMSHEIRTPINAILGMDTMILRESDDKDILEYAGNIQSASQTLLSLINDILDFSKIETGKLELVQGALRGMDIMGAGTCSRGLCTFLSYKRCLSYASRQGERKRTCI